MCLIKFLCEKKMTERHLLQDCEKQGKITFLIWKYDRQRFKILITFAQRENYLAEIGDGEMVHRFPVQNK